MYLFRYLLDSLPASEEFIELTKSALLAGLEGLQFEYHGILNYIRSN